MKTNDINNLKNYPDFNTVYYNNWSIQEDRRANSDVVNQGAEKMLRQNKWLN